jgi:hypothetical protein
MTHTDRAADLAERDAQALTGAQQEDAPTIDETPASNVPVRATWKQHGNPQSFTFYGTAVKAPEDQGVKVAKVVKTDDGLSLKGANGRQVKTGLFSPGTKFWAADVVPAPADAPAPTPPPALDEGRVNGARAKAEQIAFELDDVLLAAKGSDDPLERIMALTELIGAARSLVSDASEARIAAVRAAHADGLKLTVISKASGLSAARLQQIKSGRRAYVPVAERN